MTNGFIDRVQANPDVPKQAAAAVVDAAQKGIPVAPVDDVEKALKENGLSSDEAKAVADDYGDAQLFGLEAVVADHDGEVGLLSCRRHRARRQGGYRDQEARAPGPKPLGIRFQIHQEAIDLNTVLFAAFGHSMNPKARFEWRMTGPRSQYV